MSMFEYDLDNYLDGVGMMDEFIDVEITLKKNVKKNMSQLPQITIADLLTGTRVGMITARITEV